LGPFTSFKLEKNDSLQLKSCFNIECCLQEKNRRAATKIHTELFIIGLQLKFSYF
jgi:hypothetical protein